MSKNLTRKSLALGTASVMVASGFGLLPANANGLADTSFVSLTPTTGTEYAVVASTGATFALTANEASTVVSGPLKFLVTDTSGVIEPTAASAGRTALTLATGTPDTATVAEATNTVTLTDVSATSVALAEGDKIVFASGIGTGTVTSGVPANLLAAANTVYTVSAVSTNTFSFVSATTYVTGLTADATSANLTVGGDVKVVREARNSLNNTFVIDSGVANAAANENITLSTTGDTTRSVTVRAWVDANTNDTLDSTEYASPTRTVTFIKPSELTFAATLATPVQGDQYLAATVKTTPVLNGNQVDAQDASAVFGGLFTRQGSTAEVAAADGDSTWDDTDKEWDVKVDLTVGTAWTGLTDVDLTGAAATATAAATSVSVTTTNNHNLVSGDLVTITTTGNPVAAKAITVTGPKTFTYSVTSAAAQTGVSLTISVVTWGSGVSINDRAFPGTYSFRPAIGSTKYGSLASATSGTSTSADSTLAITGTSSIQPGSFTSVDNANNVEVKKATVSVPVVVSVVDADEKAVSAGRNVVISLGAPNEGAQSGTFKINGKTAPVTLTTDANGRVSFTVEENDGDDAAQVRVTATPEGLTSAASSVDLIWNDVSYTLYDLAHQAGTRVEVRTMNKGGSHTFKFAVLDQWKAGAGADYRLKVENAGRTVSAAYYTLTNGAVDVTVSDSQIGSGSVIDTDITVEKNVSGTWTRQDTMSWDSGSSGQGDLEFTIYDQTDKVNLDSDGSTLYGSGTADLSDALAAKTTVAQDRRNQNVVQPVYTNDVVVTGNVTNALTGVARKGAVVTLSGPSNVLFSASAVDSFGSITVIADANGEFSVALYSNVAQKDSVITVTSNGASSTVKVTFEAAAANTAKSWDASATPANALPGSTYQVSATLKDAVGNAVKVLTADTPNITVTYSGPGIVFGTLPTETDANGVVKFAVLLGSNDKGTATISFSYDLNGDGDTVDTGDFITTKSVVIGASAATQGTSVKREGNTVAVRVTGYAKSRIVLNGVRVASRTTLGALSRTLTLRAGRNVIQIVVDGTVIRTVRYTR